MSSESFSDQPNCPSCGAENELASSSSWDKVGYVPIICTKCTNLFWSRLTPGGTEKIVVNRVPVFKVQIPELPEDTWVFVVNKDHEKHLEPGQITKRDHKHYRIKFVDGTQLWVPMHWIERIPWTV